MSCTKKQVGPSTAFNSSKASWDRLKKENSNSYSYETSFKSWSGYEEKTKITVKNGVVQSREFRLIRYAPQEEQIESFEEGFNNLGSNEKGTKAVSFDQIYLECENDILKKDSTENFIYFENNEEGILKLCGYFPKNCSDDCFNGYRISNFEWEK